MEGVCMKKVIINCILIMIIIFNALLPQNSYAINPDITQNGGNDVVINQPKTGDNTTTDGNSTNSSKKTIFDETYSDIEKSGVKDINSITNGEADVNGKKQQLSETGNIFTTITRILCSIVSILPKTIDFLMSIVVQPYYDQSKVSNEELAKKYGDTFKDFRWFTIQDLVFGNITLFNVNFFDTTTGNNVKDNPNIKIKENVRTWYYSLNTLAIMVALSTVAEDQAKYKSMLYEWLGSCVLLFLLPFLLTFLFQIESALLSLVPQPGDQKNFENMFTMQLYETVFGDNNEESIIKILTSTVTLVILVIFQVKYFVKYLIRFIKIGFLIVISPLITITYTIDKRSAYQMWLKELLGAVFMQIVNALIYTIFIFSTANIMTKAPLLIVAFFMALTKGEKIFYALFKIKEQ